MFQWPGGRSCAVAANSSKRRLLPLFAESSRPYRETELHPGKTNKSQSSYRLYFALNSLVQLVHSDADGLSPAVSTKVHLYCKKIFCPINSFHVCHPCLRKSTKDDSVGRYSILHLLVYHCFDCKETKESQVESQGDFFFQESTFVNNKWLSSKWFQICAPNNKLQAHLHTVLRCPFNPGLVFLRICAQAIDVKPAAGA